MSMHDLSDKQRVRNHDARQDEDNRERAKAERQQAKSEEREAAHRLHKQQEEAAKGGDE